MVPEHGRNHPVVFVLLPVSVTVTMVACETGLGSGGSWYLVLMINLRVAASVCWCFVEDFCVQFTRKMDVVFMLLSLLVFLS